MNLPEQRGVGTCHRLPEDPAEMGDAAWFGRLNAFEQDETRRQVRFKRVHWPRLPDGSWAGRRAYTYPHILPEGHDHLNLYPATRDAVLSYLKENDIEAHREFANLRSSQVCCLNFLFPLRMALAKAAVALRPVLPGVTAVERIEFEYTGPGGDAATRWLGEPPGGKRGQNRTSADAAVWWTDDEGRKRLTLVEWKYTERQFGTCGGFASEGNKQKEKCRHWDHATFSPSQDCYLARGETSRNCRKYWARLADAGIALEAYLDELCPFIGPFYQLMRLHLLRGYLAHEGVADSADVAAIHFRGNCSLEAPPSKLHHLGADMQSAWQRLLVRPDDFRVCQAEDLAAAIQESRVETELSDYLKERYGV
jgi:hypothetical protein